MSSPTGPPFQFGAAYGYIRAHNGTTTPTHKYQPPPPHNLGTAFSPHWEMGKPTPWQLTPPPLRPPHKPNPVQRQQISSASRASCLAKACNQMRAEATRSGEQSAMGIRPRKSETCWFCSSPFTVSLLNASAGCASQRHLGPRVVWLHRPTGTVEFTLRNVPLVWTGCGTSARPLRKGTSVPLGVYHVYYLPLGVFARARLNFVPIATVSLTLLLTVLNPMTLRRLLRKLSAPISGSLRKLHIALSSLEDLEPN